MYKKMKGYTKRTVFILALMLVVFFVSPREVRASSYYDYILFSSGHKGKISGNTMTIEKSTINITTLNKPNSENNNPELRNKVKIIKFADDANIEEIGERCFSNEYFPNLEKITIPNTVTDIGQYAFYQCKKLEKVFIFRSTFNIGDNAFKTNSNLIIYCLNAKQAMQLVLKDKGLNYKVLYQLILDGNGGTPSSETLYIANGEYGSYNNKGIKEFPDATRGGYEVEGWYTERTGGKKVLGDGGAGTSNSNYSVAGYIDENNNWTVNGDITLYAHWTKVLTVVFNRNRYDGDPLQSDEIYYYKGQPGQKLINNQWTIERIYVWWMEV